MSAEELDSIKREAEDKRYFDESKRMEARQIKNWEAHLAREEGSSNKSFKDKFLSRFWWSHDDLDTRRIDQLEKQGHLNDTDREILRKEYLETHSNSKKSSPTHSDPELARDHNKYFPKPDTYDQDLIKIKDNTSINSSLYSAP